jgi:pimeloyl-ACP methyl ester carboxylesterase
MSADETRNLVRVEWLSLSMLFVLSVTAESVLAEIVRIDSSVPGLQLALHHESPIKARANQPPSIVLFAEGSAVPTSGNAAFRLNGWSWMEDLAANGFDVWSLDYLGSGESSRYPPGQHGPPPGRASDCASQLETGARYILKRQHAQKVSVIGDSFGSLVAGIFATRAATLLDKLVLFAPVTPVFKPAATVESPSPPSPQYDLVTVDDFWQLYSSWVPDGQGPALDRDFFTTNWGPRYLDSDPTSRQRTPPSVMIPAGPDVDLADVGAGRFPYDPAHIRAPTLIVLGEWDSVATDEGAKRLFDLLSGTPEKLRIVIGRATHILQLESTRFQAYRAVQTFLEVTERRRSVTP